MQHHILYLRDVIHQLDDDPGACMKFWQEPALKLVHITEILKVSVHYKDSVAEESDCAARAREIITFINDKKWDHHTWRAHDCHFHVTFSQFVCCPFTCLSEIEECLSKILKEHYHA